jgi:protein arginine kinase activator
MKEKCQRCSKPVTYHITDVDKSEVREYHFCDEHARQHLAASEEAPAQPLGELAGGSAKSAQPAQREPTAAEKRACPHCQISFVDFRNSGRLGCPYDYEVFRDELMPLLENIHDDTAHHGKVPRRSPQSTQRQSELIELRRLLRKTIEVEDYETAARLRDQIKNLEQGKDAGR